MKTANNSYGHEGQTKEFKTSFYISAGNHGKDQQFVVFSAACAMMNTEGGDIYIGVNDDGEVAKGPHYGVRGDIEKIRNIQTNDAYARYINQCISQYFFESKHIRGLMFAEETDCDDVIRIRIKKADRVVYIHERNSDARLAYRREGASTRLMNKSMVAQRENELSQEKTKKNASSKEEKIRLRVQEAIDRKCKLVLFGYNSSNSDSKGNRIVEPISFICGGRSIWAYEEKNEGNDPLRQFRLNRIDNVKVLDEACEHEDLYLEAQVDAFEWSRPTKPTIHVNMIIGPAAMNYLVEDSPESQKYLTALEDGRWLFDADVHELTPVKKFCREYKDTIDVYMPEELKEELGLVNHITSIPETKEESKGYVEKEANATDVKQTTCSPKSLMKLIRKAIGIYIRQRRSQREIKRSQYIIEETSIALLHD